MEHSILEWVRGRTRRVGGLRLNSLGGHVPPAFRSDDCLFAALRCCDAVSDAVTLQGSRGRAELLSRTASQFFSSSGPSRSEEGLWRRSTCVEPPGSLRQPESCNATRRPCGGPKDPIKRPAVDRSAIKYVKNFSSPASKIAKFGSTSVGVDNSTV
ncbi:hypothetical protein BO71DRAFT_38387 [Aspergillus ellipticus CBS 707.79]|uniref:Uncharacterized protein n=1 Tax=Aspergillus ellipticus CBS 707.79 TaxID=1448320 RepID=A0A319D2T4_9EURO|nr:hypothetical protein BO71DRAFT_38387 [Aspergillus ellipticus CBS 707.79]